MKKNERYIFEEMPARRAVLTQILPAIAAQLIAIIYSLADTYFVGMLNEPSETAALTVAASSFLMLTAISNLFGIGGAGRIAKLIAQGKNDQAKKTAATAFWCGLIVSVLFSAIYAILARSILTLCGATEATIESAYNYVLWTVIIGGPFNIIASLLSNLVRSEGKAMSASVGLSLGGIINIILDPFFVLPQFLNLGAAGAGIATALSNAVSVVFFLIYIFIRRKKSVIDLKPVSLSDLRTNITEVMKIGLPSAVQYALTVVAVSVQSAFMAKYSTEAIAAMGIVKKLDHFPLYISIGISNGLLPLLAYNYASGNKQRRRAIFKFGCTISVCSAIAFVVIYELFAPSLTSLFIKDTLTVELASAFLRRMVTAMPLMALCYPMIIQFQAAGRTREAIIISILRKGVIDFPIMLLLDGIYPMYGCTLVQPIVDCIALIVTLIFYFNLRKKDVM